MIFDGPELPGPLGDVSPWLDMCNRPLGEVTAVLAAQTHRRFIKTHTPLDGLPLHDDVTYLEVGRDPRDVAISFEHHGDNMDSERFKQVRAAAVGNEDLAELPERRIPSEDPVGRFRSLVADEPSSEQTTVASVLHHLDTGWQRRRDPNVALFHYADWTADLAGELLRLACDLGIPCSPERARALAAETSLTRMRERAAEVAPDASQGHWKDVCAFFRGTAASGAHGSRPPASPHTRYGSRRSSARISPPGPTAAGSRRVSIPNADTRPRATARALG